MMLLFVFDIIKAACEVEHIAYIVCVLSIAICYFRVESLYNDVSLVLMDADATMWQISYLTAQYFFKSTLNYLMFDGCVFSTLYLFFHAIRMIFFGKLSMDELQSLNETLTSNTLFRVIFMVYIFYYYHEVNVYEFAFWSIITEFTLCMKSISHLVILRCKLVPQSIAFDQALPIITLIKYTFLLIFVIFASCFSLLYGCYQFFYAQTGLIPLLCLLFDTIIVLFDCLHAFILVLVHFYRQNTDICVYYADLLCSVFCEILKLCYYAVILYVIGLNFSLIGIFVLMRVRTCLQRIQGNIKAYSSYTNIYQQINHQYPNASNEELILNKDSNDRENETNDKYEMCGICREPMRDAKKLPCSHIFHLRCLMGWMRYKQTCPICRRNLGSTSEANNNANANANANANNNVHNNNSNNNNNSNLPWWLRLFSRFIQIHNVDIIEANPRNLVGNVLRRRRQHRVNSMNTEQQITRISEILGGNVSQQDIRMRLLRSHSMERTIEHFLTQ